MSKRGKRMTANPKSYHIDTISSTSVRLEAEPLHKIENKLGIVNARQFELGSVSCSFVGTNVTITHIVMLQYRQALRMARWRSYACGDIYIY